ncbi:hypothetical protein GCM10010320_81360 [Streptomyces caelestis]|nr:hypothetical protein GCM10010320_81360 [Streptomyces caelestis]
MPRRGQRHPQSGRPEPPQPPQRERQPDLARLTRQPLHPVHSVLTDDGEYSVIRRDKSGQKGISPSCETSCARFREHVPTLGPSKDRTEGMSGGTGGVDFMEGCAHRRGGPSHRLTRQPRPATLQGETTRS